MRPEPSNSAVVVHEPAEIQVEPSSLLAVIAAAATDPRVDVEKMERLLAMQQVILTQQRETAFAEAMARLQAKLPQIHEGGRIVPKAGPARRYARIEDIDDSIRPLLAEEGFSFSFDSEALPDGKHVKFFCELTHRAGHSRIRSLPMPLDVSEFRTNVQNVGSTVKYARRYLLAMQLNLITRGEDDDGMGGSKPITQQQAQGIAAFLDEVKADKARFLKFMGVESVESILTRDYKKAIAALEEKRRSQLSKS